MGLFGFIAKCIVVFIMVCLFAALLYDPKGFLEVMILIIGALGPFWELCRIMGLWMLDGLRHLPEWIDALLKFWKYG